MGKFPLIGLIGLICGSYAHAVGLRLFLSHQGLSDPNSTQSDAVAPQVGVDPDAVGAPSRLYLWAQIIGTNVQKWHAVSVFISTTDTATITDYRFWNYFNTIGQKRWTDITSIDSAFPAFGGPYNDSIETRMMAALDRGLWNDWIAEHFDRQYFHGSQSALLGWIEFEGVGFIQLSIGSLGISRSDTPDGDPIYLGWTGNPLHSWRDRGKTDPDFEGSINIPEPAALFLLSCGALALRRR